MRVLAAVDKFRGSASGSEVASAIGHACWELGHDCVEFALADGGEGLLEVLGGPNRTTVVTGPDGSPVEAAWRADGRRTQDHRRTGWLRDHRWRTRAIGAIGAPARLKGVEFLVACDVTTRFTDAATVFGPQKGASPAQIKMLTNRLEQLADRYEREYEVDVRAIEGSGAAGGLAGALAALGGRLVPGFELVADELDVYDQLHDADLVITGEGHLDRQSFEGKVVGGVAELAADHGVPVAAIVGIADADVVDRIPTWAIAERFGEERSMREPLWCVEQIAGDVLRAFESGSLAPATPPEAAGG